MELIRYVPGDPPGNQLVAAAAAGDLPHIVALLKEGTSVDSHDTRYKQTALHAAADAGQLKVVEYLIGQQANLNSLDEIEMTPLMQACSSGRSKAALQLIAAGADVTHERSSDQMTALKFALWGQCSRTVIRRLLANGAKEPEAGFQVIHLVSEEPRERSRFRQLLLILLLLAGAVCFFLVFKQIESTRL